MRIGLVPAFGQPAPKPPLDPVALSALLLDGLEAADLGAVLLVGHSAGCQVVAEMAVSAPHLVRGLVLAGPATDPRAAGWPRLVLRWCRTAVREWPGRLPLLLLVRN